MSSTIIRTRRGSACGALPRRQDGVALVLALVVLLLITVLGVSGLQTTTLEERMAANARDRDLAFQAAEAALDRAEDALEAMDAAQLESFPEACATTPHFDADRAVPAACDWNEVPLSAGTIAGVAEQPRYVIEEMAEVQQQIDTLNLSNTGAALGARTKIFRITAEGVGGSDRARVILQTTYGRVML